MTDEQISQVVKSLEPLFLGYKATKNSLKNSNGMELFFRSSWNDKTTVSGLHAGRSHSIGCSFKKSPDKIFKDIRKRLMPRYYEDFFKYKKEEQEREEIKNAKAEKMRAISSVIDGEIRKNYGYSYNSGNFVSAQNLSIYETYSGHYEVTIQLDFMTAMKLAQYLKSSNLIDEKKEDD